MNHLLAQDDNSPQQFLDALEKYGGRITDLDQGTTLTGNQVRDGWKMLSRRFGESGLIPGDRVIVAVGNGPLFIAVWAAILQRGGAPIPVHFETPPMELNRIACRCHAAHIVTDHHVETEMELVESHACTLECSSWGRVVWSAVYSNGRSPGADAELDFAGIPLHPTSGTTGDPKLAIRPIRTAIAEIDNYVNTFGIDADDTILGMTPMSHAFAHGFCAIAPVMTGANLAIMRKFRATLVSQACLEMKISLVATVAGVLDTMLFTGGAALKNSARKIFSGGGPLTTHTASQFQRIIGIAPRPLYGTTETGGIAVGGEEELSLHGRVGAMLHGVTTRLDPLESTGTDSENLWNDQHERPLSRIHVQSRSLMLGYLVNEAIDTTVFHDGWYNTGDLGYIEPDGALHLHGREAEVINISGLKVLPREVEDVINSLQKVREVKVFGHKNRSGSYQLRAAVVADGMTQEEIRAHCREQLVYYKQPSMIIMVSSLPKNANGKVILSQLTNLSQDDSP